MKYAFNIVAVLGLIISLILVALFFTQRDRFIVTKTEAKEFLEELESLHEKQEFIFEEIKSIQVSISNLNINIKDKTLILAEHNMRLNEMEYLINEIFLNSSIIKSTQSNDFSESETEQKEFLIEKFRESDSFFSEVSDAEIAEIDNIEDSLDTFDKIIEEKIIYFLSPDDYLIYKKSFIDSQEFDRLSDLIIRISENKTTPLSVHQQVKLMIAAFEETAIFKQKYGENYNIPVKEFDKKMMLRSKDFLSDSQFTALKEFTKGE